MRAAGHQVYDFRNPTGPGENPDNGFHWSDIDARWQQWTPEQFVAGLDHPLAETGFNRDFTALAAADAVVLVMPCGRSAHLELGWAAGRNKLTCILLEDGEPELMYKMVTFLTPNMQDIIRYLEEPPT